MKFFHETFDLLSARPFENLVREGVYRFHLFTIKLFLLGGCRPPDPLLFLGGFQPPRPPGGGPAAPRAPLHTERLRLSGSPFFLVPRSWYQDLGTKILAPGSWYQDLGTRILVSRSLGEPVWYAGETPPGGRGPSEIVLVRTISEKGR